MPPRLNDEQVGKLIEMLNAPKEPTNKFSFSREINLGHVVVALTFIIGGFASYLSFHDGISERTARIKALEVSQERSDKTMGQIATNQDRTEKAVSQLVWIVDRMEKKEANK